MLLIRTYLEKSNIKGIGLFADQDVPKGGIIGINDENYSIQRWEEREWNEFIKQLSPESARQIKKYAVKDRNEHCYFLNLDDTRFINHSSDPNIATVETEDIAIKDIRQGDELLIDYQTFYDSQYFNEIIGME